MANQQDVNPWVLDTVMPTPYKSAVFIRDMLWDEQVAAGDRLVIKDMNGRIIVDLTASGPSVIERPGRIGWVNGLQVTILGSGKVTIAV